jgi:hypothetical protein
MRSFDCYLSRIRLVMENNLSMPPSLFSWKAVMQVTGENPCIKSQGFAVFEVCNMSMHDFSAIVARLGPGFTILNLLPYLDN